MSGVCAGPLPAGGAVGGEMRAALGLLGFLGLLALQVRAEPAPRVPLRTRTYIIHIEKQPRTVQLRQQ